MKDMDDIKSQLLKDLLNNYYDTLEEHNENMLMHPGDLLDLTCSVMVMFCRDLTVNLLNALSIADKRKELLNDICQNLKDQVNETIRKQMI